MSMTWSMTCTLYDTAGAHVRREYSLAHHIFVGPVVNCTAVLTRATPSFVIQAPLRGRSPPPTSFRFKFFCIFVPFGHILNQMIIDSRTICIVPSQLAAPKSCGLTAYNSAFCWRERDANRSPLFDVRPGDIFTSFRSAPPATINIIRLLKQRKSA